METVYRDYSDRGVNFYYIYKALAHPETNGFITPYTLEERLQHVAAAKQRLGTEITWLCDSMSNETKHALGDRPNSEFVIDPEGKIVIKRSWSNPAQLRDDLASLVGPSEQTTTIGDLDMPRPSPPQQAPTGVVDRLQLPGTFLPLVVEPGAGFDTSDTPYYVKLRAEADRNALSNGNGQLYLGFFLDPIHEVHWNNEVDPPTYELSVSSASSVTPAQGEGPKVEVKADADPREFLIEIADFDAGDQIQVTLRYIACDDAETFCQPATQTYTIYLERDVDGGSRRQAGGRSRGGRQGGGNEGRQPNPGDRRGGRGGGRGGNGPQMQVPTQLIRMLEQSDTNEDGRLTRNELPERMADRILARFDTNENGVLDADELEAMKDDRAN